MLSAAHVLAMDAKNLLDVVDTIKQRYESIFTEYYVSFSPYWTVQIMFYSFTFHTLRALLPSPQLVTPQLVSS